MTEKRFKIRSKKAAGYVAVILSILMFSVMVFSAFYIVSEADHDCCGEDCPICLHMDQCLSMLRNLSDPVVAVAMAAVAGLMLSAVLPVPRSVSRLITPVTCKVRMNH